MKKLIVLSSLLLLVIFGVYWFYPYFNKPDVSTLKVEANSEEYGVEDFGCTGMDKRSPVDGLYHIECVGKVTKGATCQSAIYVASERQWRCDE